MRSFRLSAAARRGRRRQAPEPPIPRLARSYQLVERQHIDRLSYPSVDVPSLCPSIHDVPYIQGLFANENNFAPETSCEVFDVLEMTGQAMLGSWRAIRGEVNMASFISHIVHETLVRAESETKSDVGEPSLTTTIVQKADPLPSFCTIEPAANTSFGFQLSASKSCASQLFSTLRVCPQFCSSMLGEPDYWAPLAIESRTEDGIVARTEYEVERHSSTSFAFQQLLKLNVSEKFDTEYTYQFPRYTIRTRQQTCSVWLAYDIRNATTTYIVSSGADEAWVSRAKERLTQCFARSSENEVPFVVSEGHDPFLFQSILCHESLFGARVPITQVRHKLYDVLDVVGQYSRDPFDRASLKQMTEELHEVSQDADSLLASADMGSMIARHSAHNRMDLLKKLDNTNRSSTPPFAASNVGDALEYLVQSLESQKRWLSSYQSRKDIAMNLVFNLVTQQDSETSTAIARDTKDDSASMKVIAVLTMIFLPATAVSSFFGMAFFSLSDGGAFLSTKMAWLFVAATLPLTAVTFLLWIFWELVVHFMQNRIFRLRIDRIKSV